MTKDSNTRVLGIDPAPAKATWICSDGPSFVKQLPQQIGEYLAEQVASGGDVLVAWDAPLSFDPQHGFADRPIDRVVRRALKGHLRISDKAVNVLPFAGCPHWAISSHVLGYPAGRPALGLNLVDAPGPGRRLIEVHPAVAIAVWWCLFDVPGKMPKYKSIPRKDGGREAQRRALAAIADALAPLDPPEAVRDSDDRLDAWVAWRLGRDFLTGEAELVGSVAAGGYVLPTGAADALGLILEDAKKFPSSRVPSGVPIDSG